MMILKQSTAVTIKLGPFVDDTDGKTAEGSLTISQADVRLSKNGGDMAQKNSATAASHDELGYYDVALNATDTGTLGRLRVMVSESGALPVWADYLVVPANVYDALVLGTDYLQADAVQLEGSDTSDTIATLATAAALATVDGIVDDILTDTGTTLPAAIAGIETGSAPTASQNAAAVWGAALAGFSGAGTAGKKLADAATASQLQAAVAAGVVNTAITGRYEVITGTTWTASITGLGDMTGRTALYVMVKAAQDDDDDAAILQWTEGTGLTRLGGEATTAGYGAVTVEGDGDGDITVSLTVDGTRGLAGHEATGLTLAVKCIKAGEIWERFGSNFDIVDGWIDAVA